MEQVKEKICKKIKFSNITSMKSQTEIIKEKFSLFVKCDVKSCRYKQIKNEIYQ